MSAMIEGPRPGVGSSAQCDGCCWGRGHTATQCSGPYEPLSIIWPKSLVLTMNCEFAITITVQKVLYPKQVDELASRL